MPGVVFAFTVGSLGDILATAGLAGQIAKTLYDSASVNAECGALLLELKSLQKTLILIHHALQHYLASPIGEALAGFIEPEVAQAHLLLQGYLDKVNVCRKALMSTTIASLWRRVAWTASSETLTLNEKLRHHEGKLTMLLVALNSVGLLDLGTEIRHIGAHVREVHAYLLENARPLRRIQDNTIRVLDPLGETIPIPDLFLSTWESFDHIIKGYFRNRIGQRYVEQGQYEVLHSNDSQLIIPSQFSNTVKAGDELEMSIVLRQKIVTGEENTRRCPRCYYDNADISDELRRWIQCARCSGRFQISRSQLDPLNHQNLGDEFDEKYTGSEVGDMAQTSLETIGDSKGLSLQSEVYFFRRISSYYFELSAQKPIVIYAGKAYEPPQWMQLALSAIAKKPKYANDMLKATLRKHKADETPDWRIWCWDCPGKLYFPGPGETLSNLTVHLQNRQHRQRVNKRLAAATATSAGVNS